VGGKGAPDATRYGSGPDARDSMRGHFQVLDHFEDVIAHAGARRHRTAPLQFVWNIDREDRPPHSEHRAGQ
jgi:hypothetical protein